MSEPLLEVREVTRRFGGTLAVDAVSFTLEAGRLTSLIGPNGAGKSTLVNLVAGRQQPSSGEVRLRGQRLPGTAYGAARLGIGRLFQDVRLFGGLTVLENVMAGVPDQAGEGVWAALFRPGRLRADLRRAREVAHAQLELVGLSDRADSLAGALSYGQAKLVALARLLAAEPLLLLLDEPASGIHPRLVDQLAGLVRRIVATGPTVLLVEHNMALVAEVSDRVLLLDRGRLVADGTAEQVLSGPAIASAYYLTEKLPPEVPQLSSLRNIAG